MISLHRYFTAKASLRYNPNMVATTIERGRKTDAPTSFWAVSGGTQAMGDTPGAALDNLLRQLPQGFGGPLVVLPRNQPDEFFTREQQERLSGIDRREAPPLPH